MKKIGTIKLLSLFVFSVTFSHLVAQETVKLNQTGFHPNAKKIAIIPSSTKGEFTIRGGEDGEVVFNGETSGSNFWSFSEENVVQADFTELTTPGQYRLEFESGDQSFPFVIKENVHRDLAKASIKALYFNRSSMKLEEQFAGKWNRIMGHPDDEVKVHESAASANCPEGTVISGPKGWYDAGDYNKYVVNSGISTYTVLAAWEHYPEFYNDLNLDIPESSNELPDILDEAKWNLDWMMTMQDPEDGGVYHKLTSKNFSGKVMPHEDNDGRYVVMKTTAATLDFAAVMATAARIFENTRPEFSQKALEAAEYAWTWAQEHPDVPFSQPADVSTGTYGDSDFSDEFDWAAAELFITTGNEMYWNSRNFQNSHIGVPAWPYVRPLAWVSLFHHRNDLPEVADVSLIEQRIRQQGNTLLDEYQSSPYKISMGHQSSDFVWGSNSIALNQSMMLIQTYRLTGNEEFLNAALSNLDYILGRNATGFSFVTGFGDHPPTDIHHRQSVSDNVGEPVPGFVVGGPHDGQQDGCEYPSDLPAKSYLDDWCSFSTNEVAINWNASLIYTSGALSFFLNDLTATSIDVGGNELPQRFELKQNYPNPFNPNTTIQYNVAEAGKVKISVYDFLGREVAVLLNREQSPGVHQVQFNAEGLGSGVYIYRLQSNNFDEARKMTLIK